jgi:hypothetical protein
VPTSDRSLVKRERHRFFPAVAFDREKIKQAVAELAPNGVFVGTSSWKYEGWFWQLAAT